jgi:hypothetical protein
MGPTTAPAIIAPKWPLLCEPLLVLDDAASDDDPDAGVSVDAKASLVTSTSVVGMIFAAAGLVRMC